MLNYEEQCQFFVLDIVAVKVKVKVKQSHYKPGQALSFP
jgi:hypothetical protein